MYDLIYTNRTNKRGGGVLIFVLKDFRFVKIDEFSVAIDDVLESVTLEVNVECGKNFIISCVYRAPGSDLDSFFKYIELFLQSIKNNKSIYLCGDFNIDLLKEQTHKGTNDFLELLNSFGLFPTITKPTRVTSTSATLIDNIFTNNIFQITLSGILCNDISDHLPVFCICKGHTFKGDVKGYHNVRKITDTEINHFKNALSSHNWEDMYNCYDVNDSYNYFLKIFTDLYESHFPVKRVKINSRNDIKPWMTKGLVNACKKKNKMYKDFIKTRCKILEKKYKHYKNKLTSILRYCEKHFYSNLLEKSRNNVRATWDIVNGIIKNKSISNIPNVFVQDGKNIVGGLNIANGFNDFFVNVGPNLAKNIPKYDHIDVVDYMNDINSSSMFLLPVDEKEVLRTVNDCKSKTSEDSDNLSMKFVKEVFSYIAKPFTYICNLSFKYGVFPDKMKIAKVKPLFKSGDHNSRKYCLILKKKYNYRPVSLLSSFK